MNDKKAMLDTRIFTPAILATDAKDYRESLRHIMIEYDAEKDVLITVGTNAQIMVITKARITDAEAIEFCKSVFEQGKGYMLPESVLKTKSPVCVFENIDGRLLCDGNVVNIFDGTMPNWRAVMPEKKDLMYATMWAGFDPDLVKKADKAVGNRKGNSIMDKRPYVFADTDKDGEYMAPHIWKTADETGYSQLALVMPRRLS